MSDSGLSREFVKSIQSRCNTDLDSDLMVFIAKARPYVVLAAITRWSCKTLGTTMVLRDSWDRCGYHLRMRLMGDFLRRVAGENAALAGDPVLPLDFVERFPAIADYLRSGKWPDGSPRRRSAITLLAGDGEGFKCVLNDPDQNRGIWATAKTLEGLFVALEALAADPRAPWKPSKPPGNRR